MHIWLLAIIVVLTPLFGVHAQEQESVPRHEDTTAFHTALGECADPCIIKPNRGGSVETFRSAARGGLSGLEKQIVIGVPCISACAIFADLARPRVCIAEGAVFLFHMARHPMLNIEWFTIKSISTGFIGEPLIFIYSDPPQSPDIDAWVKSRGGYPKDRFLVMPFSTAKNFWPICAKEQASR